MPSFPALQPYDDHNQLLEARTHPADWENPTPSGRYNLVVIGAGTAGLVAAAGAAGLGAKVALIERELMGGDCLTVGCVPSKGLISSARIARTIRDAHDFGIDAESINIDFPRVMERMRRLRASISPNDSAERFRSLGIDVYLGSGEFIGRDRIRVGEQILQFKKAVIATGARATVPPIPGLDEVSYLTNETLFSLTELPRRLGVVGAGPIGCEIAQTFARLGSEVFLIEKADRILPNDDSDAAAVVQKSLERDGVTVLCCGQHLKVRNAADSAVIEVDARGVHYSEQVDQLVISTGRAPNVEGLGLEQAGVEFDLRQGVTVNDRLQTTNSNIFAAGDVCSQHKFTHAADFNARLVIQNALFLGRSKASSLLIPWCTYTSPELAHVGLTSTQATERDIRCDTYQQDFTEIDRAILQGETDGFVRVLTRKGTDQILGANVVAEHAGDLISEITLAMQHRIGLKKLSSVIHPYPTQAEAIRKLGDQYNRTRLTPFVKSLFRRWLEWSR